MKENTFGSDDIMFFSRATSIYDIMVLSYHQLYESGLAHQDVIPTSGPSFGALLDFIHGQLNSELTKGFLPILIRLEEMEKSFSAEFQNPFFHLALIRYLDIHHEKWETPGKPGQIMTSLNSVHTDLYSLFPQVKNGIRDMLYVKTDNGMSLRKPDLVRAVNKILGFFLFLETADRKDILVECHPYRNLGLSQKIASERTLTFGFIPFLPKPLDQYFSIHFEDGRFRVDGTKSVPEGETGEPGDGEAYLKARYSESLRNMVAQDPVPDLILFPEMSLSKGVVKSLGEMIAGLKIRKPLLVVAGTYWNDHKNVCYVFDQDGAEILEQPKRGQFEATFEGKKYVEDLRFLPNFPPIIRFLDFHGVGRLAFFICKDLQHDPSLDVLKHMLPDCILVPMYSPSSDVLHHAGELSANYHSLVAWVNDCWSCAARQETIAGFFLPKKQGTHRSFDEIPIPFPGEECERCAKCCTGVVSTLSLKPRAIIYYPH